jgi:chemotaxis protein MotB
MTILLTFFVLMFSLTKIDMVRFIPVARSYGEVFAGGGPDENVPRLPEVAAVPGDNLSYLEAVLRPAFAKQASLADVQFRATPQYLILSWPAVGPGEGLFDAGSSGFSDAARRRVFDLGGVLSNLHNRIAIVGQAVAMAGPVPPEGVSAEGVAADAGADADAWHLAITRANAVADAFTASGYDKEITVLGRKAPLGNIEQIQVLIMPEQPGS